MWVSIKDISKYGIITDVVSHLLPVGAWSNGRNVQFFHDRVTRLDGEIIIAVGGTANGNFWSMPVEIGDKTVYVIGAEEVIYTYARDDNDRPVRVNRTRDVGGAYSANPRDRWNGGILGGLVIVNNTSDIPQYWDPTEVGGKFKDFPNGGDNADKKFPTDLTARVMRPFNSFIVLGNLKYGTDPRLEDSIRWSNPAIPGNMPTNWALDDGSTEAGETQLNDPTPDGIVDMVPMRDWLIIYKRYSIWAMRFIGGNNIFSFERLFQGRGAIAPNCVAPFVHQGGLFHCVLTGTDVIIHDGRSVVRQLEKRVTNALNVNYTDDDYQKSFIFNNPHTYENWICFVPQGSDNVTKAIVWNYFDDTTSIRDLPANTTWTMMATSLALAAPSPITVPVAVTNSNDAIYELNRGSAGRGDQRTPRETAWLERLNMAYLPSYNGDGPFIDFESEKLLKGIRLQFKGEIKCTLKAKNTVGRGEPSVVKEVSGVLRQGISGQPDVTRLDVILQGKAFDLRLESLATTPNSSDPPNPLDNNKDFELFSLELDLEKVGTY